MVKSILNKLFFLLIFFIFLNGENLKYANLDNHTLTLPKNSFVINGGYLIVNKKVDIFHLRDTDASSDLRGIEFEGLYGINDRLMVVYKIAREKFTYNDYELYNTKNDIYFRYHLLDKFWKFNSGLSFDLGFVNNRMDDFYLTDLSSINSLARRYFKDKNVHIEKEKNGRLRLYNGNSSEDLKYYPWVGMEKTDDNSLYVKILTGVNKKHSYLDFFAGAKRTKIRNQLVANRELVQKAKEHGYNIEKNLDRYENMFFAGLNISHEYKQFLFEWGYEYDLFQRDKGLNYMKSNHIVDLSLGYKINSNFLIYLGGKLMYHQLNGQIPYLYNQYSQTTFDHKYGYAKLGFVYYFGK